MINPTKYSVLLLFVILVASYFSPSVNAQQVISFDGLTAGNLAGQGGFTGSTSVDVVHGANLVAPAGTNYQPGATTGTTGFVQGDGTGTGEQAVATTLTGTLPGERFFSFLVRPAAGESIGINLGIGEDIELRIEDLDGDGTVTLTLGGEGIDLTSGINEINGAPAGGGLPLTFDTDWTNGTDHLVVIRFENGTGSLGESYFDIWADPDVSSGIAGMGASTLRGSESGNNSNSGTNISIVTNGDDAAIDHLRVSNATDSGSAANSFSLVTTPEPSSAILFLLSAILFSFMRLKR